MNSCKKCDKKGELAYYGSEGHCKECVSYESEIDFVKWVEDAEEAIETFKEELAFTNNLKRTEDESAPSFVHGVEVSLNTEELRYKVNKQLKGE